jgi:hypothetical protein
LQEIPLLKGEKAWSRERMVQLEREKKEAGRREMTPQHGPAKKKTTACVGCL